MHDQAHNLSAHCKLLLLSLGCPQTFLVSGMKAEQATNKLSGITADMDICGTLVIAWPHP